MESDNELDRQLKAFGETLERHTGEPLRYEGPNSATSASNEVSRRGPGQRFVYLVAAATLIGVIGVGFWVAGRPAPDQIGPVAPAPTTAVLPELVDTEPLPTADATTEPSSVAPATEPTLTPTTVPEANQLQGCGDPGDAEQAAADLYTKILIARTTDNLSILDGCIDAVPNVFDGQVPNCWTQCGPRRQEFLFDTFRGGEVFNVDGHVGYSVTAAVSYIDDSGDSADVVESWTLKPTGDGLRIEDFAVQVNFLDRAASADTIAEYFGHIEAEDWDAAALMLDDGAQNLDERRDLNRLNPASFDLPDISAALADWCALGCDTQPPATNDLTFDGLYGIERNGQQVRAAWFEGNYSISGLPIKTSKALAAGFDEEAILADGTVTEDEYRTMFAFLIECAESNGAPSPIEPAEFDSLDQRFPYSIRGENSPAFDSCYDANGQAIDITFQVDPARTAQREQNYTAVAACLENAGYDYRAFIQQALDDQPDGFPEIPLDELSIDDVINLGAPYAAFENPDNQAIVAICKQA